MSCLACAVRSCASAVDAPPRPHGGNTRSPGSRPRAEVR